MKTTKKSIVRLLTLVSVLALVLSSLVVTASAFELAPGSAYAGIGTIATNDTTKSVGGVEGFDYNYTTYIDDNGYGQTMYAMEFNPATTGLMPMAYQATPSYGAQVKTSVQAAKAEGYDVLGAINGEFFSMASGNSGTLESRLITNGRIIADSEFRNDVCLAIDSEGNFNLVKSQMAYHLYINGKEVLNVEGGNPIIGTINKRYNGNNWWSPIMYFDSETDGASYSNANVAGVEVLCEKVEGTELIVEGTLQGKVLSVTENTYATPIEANQFVLYAQNGSANYNTLASLTVGQDVQIYADELNAEAEEIMKNAVTVTAATYPIVVDGADNTANTPNAEDIYMTRAQRTAIGVKADGTMVYLCTAGRGTSEEFAKGITLPELAEMMIAFGCEQAVNLDGGGSSTFYVDGKTKFTSGRKVGSSILICKRNDATSSSAKRNELTSLITQAGQNTYTGSQKDLVDAAVAQAQAVVDDTAANTGSMTADYVREAMNLKAAMGTIKTYTPKNYISLNADDWSYDSSVMQAANNETDALVLNNTNGQWPWANFSCDIDVSAGEKLYYNITVAGQASVQLVINGEAIIINDKIAPNSLDAGSGDIVGNGQTFEGSFDLSEIVEGDFNLSSVGICTVGGAGDASKVIVQHLDFTEYVPKEEDPGEDNPGEDTPGEDTPGEDTPPADDSKPSTDNNNSSVNDQQSTTTTTHDTAKNDTAKNDSPKTADVGQTALFLTVALLAAAIVMASVSAKKVTR